MASNKISENQSRLWALASDAADGLKGHGVEVHIQHNPETTVRGDLAASKAAQSSFEASKVAENDAVTAHRTANSNAKGFLALAKRQLADAQGELPAGLWPTGSTAIPDDEPKRLSLLGKIGDYLRDHPSEANDKKDFTEVLARASSKAVEDSRTQINNTVPARVKAKAARDTADSALYQRLSGLLSELGQVLSDDSENWYWFGFTPPAGAERPAKPESLTLHQVGAQSVAAGWPHAPRAEKYRLLLQVVGRDTDFIAQSWTHEDDDLLTNLPAAATLRAKLLATNAAGDSPEGDVVELKLN